MKTGHLKEFTKGVIRRTAPPFGLLTPWNKRGTMFFLCSNIRRKAMLKTFVEEAAALTSIALFVAMIAIWAQLIPQL